MTFSITDQVLAGYADRVQRLRNLLRLVFAALLAAAVCTGVPRNEWPPLLGIIAVYVLLGFGSILLWVRRPPVRHSVLVATLGGVLDVLAAFLLLEFTSPAYLLLLLLFILPVFSAFNLRRPNTLVPLACNAVAFVLAVVTDPVMVATLPTATITVVIVTHLALCLLVLTITNMQRSRTYRIGELLDSRSLLLRQVMTAEENQRRLLAETLHDEALQTLLAARHDLEEYSESGAPEDLRRTDETLQDVVRSLRRMTSEMHPDVLESAGLATALNRLLQSAKRRGMAVSWDCDDRPTGYEKLLFTVARELVANVVKHSGASHLSLTLQQSPQGVALEVIDDGAGFDPSVLDKRLAQGHIGIASLRARVEAAGGTLSYLPADRGTAVRVTLPAQGATQR
ncbi:sensor histidine kinase [Streptomyces erythrochromogenes]|uniref:sensor histidine kinase n=1 Tax=Streptomyces erythrochromogenes TaxID=285574 RepID=UPI00367F817E